MPSKRDELALTRQQYDELMKAIWKVHRFSAMSKALWDDERLWGQCKHIKYVRPNWDMRDGVCFSVRFDGLGCGKDGKQFGSGYGETEPMYDRIKAWLDTQN